MRATVIAAAYEVLPGDHGMPHVSTRDRRIEIALLAMSTILMLWALAEYFGGSERSSASLGLVLLLAGMAGGSASQLVTPRPMRWALIAASVVAVGAGLVLTLR